MAGERIFGNDVKQWYEEKSYHVVLSLQDYVDNLVWIYHKLAEYGIQGYESLKDWIFSEFAVIFERLYGGQGHPVKADIHNYYNAWNGTRRQLWLCRDMLFIWRKLN